MAEMLQTLFANPKLAIVVVLVAIILAKTLKAAGKVVKWICLIGAAYVLVNFIAAGGF